MGRLTNGWPGDLPAPTSILVIPSVQMTHKMAIVMRIQALTLYLLLPTILTVDSVTHHAVFARITKEDRSVLFASVMLL